jgi:hypothetical protein
MTWIEGEDLTPFISRYRTDEQVAALEGLQ